MRCEQPVKILEILRLTELGHSQRMIAKSVDCAKTTVCAIQKRSREYDLTYEKAKSMPDNAIKALVYPNTYGTKTLESDPNWSEIYDRLQKHKHLNMRFIWEEYFLSHMTNLGYSQFCRRYRKWQNETGKHVVMVLNHKPGEELFVDWMGDTLDCVTYPATGEIRQAHFFVASLGDSGYPYVEAFPDEKIDKWLRAHIHALEWYGGVPRTIIPDNCKVAVSKPNYYNPVFNPAYLSLAEHYSLAVIPARAGKPQDKGKVESAVGYLETWLLEWLRERQFHSFEELNIEIRERIKELATRPFKKRPGSRTSVFQKIDKPALRPLPPQPFELAEFVIRSVPSDYHVEYQNFYYSVPYSLFKQKVTLKVTMSAIEIINSNNERVATHQRRSSGQRYITIQEHMPSNHRHQAEKDRFDGGRYRSWAKSIGENTFIVIDTMLNTGTFEQLSYRSCMGLLQKTKTYGNQRVETACAKAVCLHSCTYRTVNNILKSSQDKIPLAQQSSLVISHENIRGRTEFS